MKPKGINLKELSKILKLSPSTVSRVLSGHAKKYRISTSTQKHVAEVAKKHHFQPNEIAKGLRLQKTNTIGLVIPDISNPFFANLARTIEIELRKRGKFVLLCDTNDDTALESETLSLLQGRKVDGLLVAPVGIENNHLNELAAIPMVLIDRYFNNLTIPYVSTDNFQGAYQAAQYLIKKKHERIVCIQGLPNAISNKERVRGVEQAIIDHGLPMTNIDITGSDFSIENGYQTMNKILKRTSLPTAIFTLGNQITLGAMQSIKENGLQIPKDISLISFDEQPYFSLVSPPITTIKQPIASIAKESVRILFEIMDGNKPKSKLLLPQMIERQSVRSLDI